MTEPEQFHYHRSIGLDGVTLLQATMTDFSYPRHAHEDYSFGVTLAGNQHFFSQGAQHKSPAGHVILFNPEDVHDGNSGSNEALQYMMLYVAPAALHPFLQSAGLIEPSTFRITDAVSNHPVLRENLLALARHTRASETDALMQEAALFDLAITLAETDGRADEIRPNGRIDTLIQTAKDYILDNITADLCLEGLARELSLSKFHFLRLFRQQLGITPYQYVLNCRLNQAQKALHTGASLNDVVYDFGFADLSHFNRRFKSLFGVTPHCYRKLVCH